MTATSPLGRPPSRAAPSVLPSSWRRPKLEPGRHRHQVGGFAGPGDCRLRSLLALPVFALVLWLRAGQNLPLVLRLGLGRPITWLASALLCAWTMLSFVLAAKLTTAANAILLQYTAPIYVVLLSWPLLGEKIGRRRPAVLGCFWALHGFCRAALDFRAVRQPFGFVIGAGLGLLPLLLRRTERPDPSHDDGKAASFCPCPHAGAASATSWPCSLGWLRCCVSRFPACQPGCGLRSWRCADRARLSAVCRRGAQTAPSGMSDAGIAGTDPQSDLGRAVCRRAPQSPPPSAGTAHPGIGDRPRHLLGAQAATLVPPNLHF